MIHNHQKKTQFRSLTDCLCCIVVKEFKILFNLVDYNIYVRKSCGCGEYSMFEIWSILGLLRIISGHWSEGMRISKSNDNNGILNGRDSYKKIWARSESTLRDCYYPILSVSNAFVRKSCGCGECSMFEMFWMRKESLFF